MGKLIIFSAPSGSGKSTIINYLLTQNLNLAFSISATSRPPRGTEQNGVEYFFLTPDEFRSRIANDEFLEYEEVYQDRFYGTLKAQVEKQLAAGQNVVFDVDVVGGCNESDNPIPEPMKRTKAGRLSPRANKFLLVLNIVLLLGAIVLAILSIDLKEYTSAVAMFMVVIVSGGNIYGCWKRLREKL